MRVKIDLHEAQKSIENICCLGAIVKEEDAKKHLSEINKYLQDIWKQVLKIKK
jgi:hypothetical protein